MALKELVAAGFVEVGPGKKVGPERVSAVADAYDFAARLWAMRKHRPIAEGSAAAVAKYIESTCHPGPFTAAVHEVLRRAGIDDHVAIEAMIGRYVLSHRWPGWVARFFKGAMTGSG